MGYVLDKMCNLLPLTAHSVQVLLQGSNTSNVTFMPLVENIKFSPCNREFITNSEYLNRNRVSCLSEQEPLDIRHRSVRSEFGQ